MADVKISALPAVTSIGPTDIFPIVQGTTTSKITWADATTVTLTYSAFSALRVANGLVPGVIYKITEFNRNMLSGSSENPNGYLPEILYDDGTNSGITIYVQAITTNTASTSGYGEFYNPKYADITTYTATNGTGLYQIWDGDNPTPSEVPAYQVGDVVIWGGYAWENISGNVGNALDVVTLSSDWDKLPYSNNNWYEKVIDEIKVDWNNGILVERYNPENQVKVSFNADQYEWWLAYNTTTPSTSYISTMGWGLYSKITPGQLDSIFGGISNIEVINGIMETVNFKGDILANIKVTDSGWYNNYMGINSNISEIAIHKFSVIESNILMHSSYLGNITLIVNCYIGGNTLDDNCSISGITSSNGTIQANVLNASASFASIRIDAGQISNNNLTTSNITLSNLFNASNINTNTLTNSYISYNTLENESIIDGNVLNASYIKYNTVENQSSIVSNSLLNGSNIENNQVFNKSSLTGNQLDFGNINQNVVSNFSTIKNNNLDSSAYITNNNLCTATFDFSSSGLLSTVSIQSNNAYNVDATEDISAATNIYASFTKNIFTRSDGAAKLSFIDGTNTLVIGGINS